MTIEIDPSSSVPPYDQIRLQVAAMVEGGVLPPGSRLPPIRQLAGDLGLSASTVARAYRELEHDGTLVGKGRHGTVVAPGAASLDDGARRARVADAAAAFARTARHAGVDVDQAVAALRSAFTSP